MKIGRVVELRGTAGEFRNGRCEPNASSVSQELTSHSWGAPIGADTIARSISMIFEGGAAPLPCRNRARVDDSSFCPNENSCAKSKPCLRGQDADLFNPVEG